MHGPASGSCLSDSKSQAEPKAGAGGTLLPSHSLGESDTRRALATSVLKRKARIPGEIAEAPYSTSGWCISQQVESESVSPASPIYRRCNIARGKKSTVRAKGS
jgi:hypothetical protein